MPYAARHLAVLATTAALALPLVATPPAAAQSPPAPNSVLTLTTTPLVRAPAPASISGRLTDAAGTGLAGQSVQIVYKPWAGNGTYKAIRTVQTDSTGRFALTAQPTFHSVLQARFAGSEGQDPTTSPPAVTKVQLASALATVAGRTTADYSNGPSSTVIQFEGNMAPGTVRPALYLQYQRPNGTWSTITGYQRVLTNSGIFRFERLFGEPGTYRLRIIGVETPNWHGSASRTFAVTVRSDADNEPVQCCFHD